MIDCPQPGRQPTFRFAISWAAANPFPMTDTVFVLNGPNLNLLGTREPEIYGSDTLADIEAMLGEKARDLGLAIDFRQTNHEGVLVDWLHEARSVCAKAVLLNAAAYTHTSIALLDAIKAIEVPVIEVHLSDPATREAFRHISYVGMGAVDEVKGLGARGYAVALEKAAAL
jgi:3-dehydroquinate dehydratase-2